MFRLKILNKLQIAILISLTIFTISALGNYGILSYNFSFYFNFLLIIVLLSSNFWNTIFQFPTTIKEYLFRIIRGMKFHMFFIIPITIFNLLLHHTIDTNLSEIVINNEIKRAEDRIKNQEKSLSKEKGENVTWVRKDNKSDLEKISSTINNSLSIKGIIGKGLLYFILLILYSSIVSIFRNEDLKL